MFSLTSTAVSAQLTDLYLLKLSKSGGFGFRDVLSFAIRKDAPTGSRLSQHMLLIWTASHNKFVKGEKDAWRLVSADVKSAFLKGDPYMAGDRELYMENMKDSETSDAPGLPFGRALAKIRKGVFGLSDAPRSGIFDSTGHCWSKVGNVLPWTTPVGCCGLRTSPHWMA